MTSRDSRISRAVDIGLAVGAVTGVLGGIWVGATSVGLDAWYAAEDGLIETLTVVVLLGGALLMLYLARRRASPGPRRVGLLLALLMMFGAGEELSWGQRIFDVESPTFFQETNAQGETNIHNLTIGGVSLNRLVFSQLIGVGVGAYIIVLPLLYRKRRARDLINRLGLPVPRWRQSALIIVCLGMVELIDSDRRWEVLEFAQVSLLLTSFVRPVNLDELSPDGPAVE